MAEHSLNILAPDLIRSSLELLDVKCLQPLSMARTNASYKLREGLAASLYDDAVTDLRLSFFHFSFFSFSCWRMHVKCQWEKVFSMIVSNFAHLCNVLLITITIRKALLLLANAANLFDHVKATLTKDKIPFSKLVSNLSDSTIYMRGKVSGFKTLLRKEVPHLLNIDGDIYHHAHNAVKKFTFPFGKYVEQLFSDIRADKQWILDLRQYLAEIWEILNMPYQTPADRVEHRWLLTYDAPVFQALTIMYYS